MGYGDYQIGNITILRVYYVEGLGHNLFSVGEFCDLDLDVAFRKHMCFVRNLEGDDLLSGSRETNLYMLSIRDLMASSLICLLTKASKTKSGLWHRRFSHLNFGAINHLAKNGLVRGLPKLKFEKVPFAAAPRAVDLANSLVSTSVDQDSPSTSIPTTQEQEHSLIISQRFKESPKTPHFHDDLLQESLHEDSTSPGSSSNVRPIHTPFESLGVVDPTLLAQKAGNDLLLKSIHCLSDSPTPSDLVVDSLVEETNILLSHLNDSSPDYERFCFDIEEKSSGSTTSHSYHSLPEYESFGFDVDHIE
nr:ribonuclease H-like domain-containing protein [Tanacetum cinerariifolium]GEY86879.1 ribonuclease H-like domain-containing protein [Tanacetum cinerariifolium]